MLTPLEWAGASETTNHKSHHTPNQTASKTPNYFFTMMSAMLPAYFEY